MNSRPTISICVPNLNTRPYLPERFETIFTQTLQDWELIVYDSYSDDGSWEYIQELAGREPRMKVFQGPREKTPLCWNPCIREAKGDYVYIATSDDTMMPDCLEKMVAALAGNPDCGLCQCELEIIDEKGLPFPPEQQWDRYTLGAYDEALVTKRNKRFAPHDGLLHSALFTIYTSITQLLIRRTVFDRIGYFNGQWGTIGDFEWGMRVGLLENCIYIPEKLATWRIHPAQATRDVHTVPNRLKMIGMTRAAFASASEIDARLKRIDIDDLVYFLERDIVEMGYPSGTGGQMKLRFLLGQFLSRPRPVIDFIFDRLRQRSWEPWRCANRYGRLKQTLKKYDVPLPVWV